MNYYIKRIGQGVLTFWVASTVAFVMFRMLPGSPIQAMAVTRYQECVEAGGSCSYQEIYERVQRRINIDLTEPIPEAYVGFLQDVFLHLDFGISFNYQQPVFDILFAAMPWSLFISLFGLALGRLFNIFYGAALAYKEGTRFDKYGTIFALTGNAIPYYVAAIVALSWFSFKLGWFPTGGRYPDAFVLTFPVIGTVLSEPNVQPGFNLPFMLGVIHHGSLLIFTGFVLGVNGLSMRGNSIRVMESEYIRVARLRGLSETRIAQRYVARNAVLPLYTGFMIGIAGIFSSGVITERIFTYPAVGYYTFDALENQDWPLLMGSFLFLTAVTIIGIVLADFTYGLIDPRVEGGGDSEAY